MKPLSILSFLCVFIFGLLLLISPVDAALIQDPTPPPPPSEQDMTDGQNQESPPMDYKADSGAALGTLGNIIDFNDNSTAEWHPAVAHCASDQYLVVFQQDNDIYGQRLDQSGGLIGNEFLISNGLQRSSNPDVACDWYRDVFVVTWQYEYPGPDNDIFARGIYGRRLNTGEEFMGDRIIIGSSDYQDTNPAIACNSDDHSCLIVWENNGAGAGDIWGRRINIGATGIEAPYGIFDVSLAFGPYLDNEREPDIVWSGVRDEYMLVWSYDYGDRYQIVHATVHDTQQPGLQYKPGVYSLWLNPGSQSNPAVAYSCRSDEYLVAFENLHFGKKIIYAFGIGGSTAVYFRENTDIPMLQPAVAYSNGPQDIPSGMGADQFLLTYVLKDSSTTTLMGLAFIGAFVDHNPIYVDGGPVELFSTGSGQNFGIGLSNITGSVNNGKYFVVWDKYSGGFAGFNFDINGRMIGQKSAGFNLSVTKSGNGSGVVTSNPAGINCGGNCSATYEEGTAVTLTATADAGSTFAGWSNYQWTDDCGDTNRPCVVTMSQAKSIVAYFNASTPNTVLLRVIKDGNGNGVVTSNPPGINCGNTCTASYAIGTAVTLTAAPGANSNFNGWGGACPGITPTCVVTMSQAKSIFAYFNYVGTPNIKRYLPLLFR